MNMERIVIILIFFFLTFSGVSSAEEKLNLFSKEIDSFRGVKGVNVFIAKEFLKVGVKPSKIKTEVELRLTKAGISTFTVEESASTLNSALLYINIIPVQIEDMQIYVFVINAKIQQIACLVRNRNIVMPCDTWSREMIGLADESNFKERVLEIVGDLTDKFIVDYLKVNQKSSESAD